MILTRIRANIGSLRTSACYGDYISPKLGIYLEIFKDHSLPNPPGKKSVLLFLLNDSALRLTFYTLFPLSYLKEY